MVWRGPRTARDPLLTGRAWRADRGYWQQLRLPCARCRGPIDYTGPRFLIVRGRKRLNPRYLVVGHIVSRYEARRRGWTDEQINARANQQPECQHCSNTSGARLGNRVQAARQAGRTKQPATASRW